MELSLSELASHLGAEVRGDGSTRIGGVATLSSAGANDVTFIADPAYRKQVDQAFQDFYGAGPNRQVVG